MLHVKNKRLLIYNLWSGLKRSNNQHTLLKSDELISILLKDIQIYLLSVAVLKWHRKILWIGKGLKCT